MFLSLFISIVVAGDAFIGLADDDSSSLALMDVENPSFSRTSGAVCCGFDFGATNPSIGLALSKITNEVIALLKPQGQTQHTVAVIDPCSGATNYNNTFLLQDSTTPMAMAVDPSTGLVYLLQTYNGTTWSLYTLDMATKTQTLVRKFTETNVDRCRGLAFNPTNPTLIYGIQTPSNGGTSHLMALNKLTGEFVFRDIAVGQNNLYGLAFNSTGTLFAFKKSVAPTLAYTIPLPTAPFRTTVSSRMAASIPDIKNVRSALALPESFANCLKSTGAAGPLLLSNANGTFARYSKTPEFANDNQIPLIDGLIRNSAFTKDQYEFVVVTPRGTTNLAVDLATVDGVNSTSAAVHVEQLYPFTINIGANSMTPSKVVLGTYKIVYTAIRSGTIRMPSTTATFSFVDPTTTTSTSTRTTTTTTSTTATTTSTTTMRPTTTTTTAATTSTTLTVGQTTPTSTPTIATTLTTTDGSSLTASPATTTTTTANANTPTTTTPATTTKSVTNPTTSATTATTNNNINNPTATTTTTTTNVNSNNTNANDTNTTDSLTSSNETTIVSNNNDTTAATLSLPPIDSTTTNLLNSTSFSTMSSSTSLLDDSSNSTAPSEPQTIEQILSANLQWIIVGAVALCLCIIGIVVLCCLLRARRKRTNRSDSFQNEFVSQRSDYTDAKAMEYFGDDPADNDQNSDSGKGGVSVADIRMSTVQSTELVRPAAVATLKSNNNNYAASSSLSDSQHSMYKELPIAASLRGSNEIVESPFVPLSSSSNANQRPQSMVASPFVPRVPTLRESLTSNTYQPLPSHAASGQQ